MSEQVEGQGDENRSWFTRPTFALSSHPTPPALRSPATSLQPHPPSRAHDTSKTRRAYTDDGTAYSDPPLLPFCPTSSTFFNLSLAAPSSLGHSTTARQTTLMTSALSTPRRRVYVLPAWLTLLNGRPMTSKESHCRINEPPGASSSVDLLHPLNGHKPWP